MSDTFDLEPLKDEQPSFVPGQPLPRLWKTEPEEDSEESLEEPKKKRSKDIAVAAPSSKSPSNSRASASKPAKPKPKPKKNKGDEGEKGEKRILLEETPALDTIESRQRARLIMGGLIVFCIFIFGWITYGMIFSGSGDFTVDATELPSADMMPTLPGPKRSREPEARYMLDRAREYAKRGQTKEALAMLKRVVTVYKGTQAGGEAQAALDRPRQNLPLFPDGPYVVAQQKPAEAAPASQPPTAPRPAPAPARPVPAGPELLALARPGMNPGAAGPAPAPAQPSQPQSVPSQPQSVPSQPQSVPSQPQSVPTQPQSVPTQPQRAPSRPQSPSSQPPPSLSQPPSPGPGEAALLIPANPGAATTPPASGDVGNDRGMAAAPLRPRRMLPPGFKARDEAGYHESGWPLVIVGDRDGGRMVLVPGGTFLMGSDSGDPRNRPAHSVRLSTYYIDRAEITNGQFRTFLKDTDYHGQPPGKWLTDEKLRSLPDAAPAVYVSYHDAEAYAIWALKRLPTEAQWEMAARSADGRRYPWGDEPVRWSRPRTFHQIDPAMSFVEDVSPFGAFDMAGNAIEWVRDWYDPRYFYTLRNQTTEDPTGPPTKRHGIQRVVRGGSKDWLVVDRNGMDSDRRLPYLGFRCSLAVEGGEASAGIVPHTTKPETPKPGTPPVPGQASGGDIPF